MDAQGFRLSQKSKDFNPNRWQTVEQAQKEVKAAGASIPSDDSRYPAYAAIMSDGRQFTDYRQHCQTRVPGHYQKSVRQWMINNGENIIQMTRKRQAENSGAVLGVQKTVLPVENVVFCDTFGCEMDKTNAIMGTGLQVANECPELPGTFMYVADPSVAATNVKNIELNTRNENGINTPKRWETVISPYT